MTETRPPSGLHDLPSVGVAALTMGVFDGVHLGHRAVLEATRAAAAKRGIASVALVFDPPPNELVHPGSHVPRLAPLSVNIARIEALGVGFVLPVRFDDALRGLSAPAFLAALWPAIELRGLVMSRHSSFGRDRAGTVGRMQQLARAHRFDVVVVDPITVDGGLVSSTRVRDAIAGGDLAGAQRMGVMPYLQGTVVVGDRRGRALGFPTANLAFAYAPAMPPLGIYAGRVTLAGRAMSPGHPSLVSIGTRPTFHVEGEVLVEVHLLDFDADLYGMQLGVELVAGLREERRFADVEALVEQMQRDAVMGRAVLESG